MAGVAVAREDRHGVVRWQRPEAPADGADAVAGDRADVVAGGAELVRRQLLGADGVVDDRVDVGVLQEQRPPAGAVERVAEQPHVRAVGVRDGADRAELDVARRVADRHGGARHERLRRKLRGARRRARRQQRPPGAACGAREHRRDRRAEPRQRQRRGERAAADQRRARGRASRRPRRLDRLGEDRLDRRRQPDAAAELADAGRDRADVARDAGRVGAVDRRAREARSDPRRVDRRARHANEDARVVGSLAVDDVEHLDVEARDRGAVDDRQRGAAHARRDLAERHDRIGCGCGRRRHEQCRESGEEQAAHAPRQ